MKNSPRRSRGRRRRPRRAGRSSCAGRAAAPPARRRPASRRAQRRPPLRPTPPLPSRRAFLPLSAANMLAKTACFRAQQRGPVRIVGALPIATVRTRTLFVPLDGGRAETVAQRLIDAIALGAAAGRRAPAHRDRPRRPARRLDRHPPPATAPRAARPGLVETRRGRGGGSSGARPARAAARALEARCATARRTSCATSATTAARSCGGAARRAARAGRRARDMLREHLEAPARRVLADRPPARRRGDPHRDRRRRAVPAPGARGDGSCGRRSAISYGSRRRGRGGGGDRARTAGSRRSPARARAERARRRAPRRRRDRPPAPQPRLRWGA